MVMTCSYDVLALLWFDKRSARRPPRKQRRAALARLHRKGISRRWHCVEVDLVLSAFSRTNYTGNRCQYVYRVVGDRLQHRAIYGREIIITHTMTKSSCMYTAHYAETTGWGISWVSSLLCVKQTARVETMAACQ